MTQLASDSFTRANENPIVGNWSSGPGAWDDCQLLSNAFLGALGSGDCAAYYTGVSWPNDQYSEGKITTFTNDDGGPLVRGQAGAKSGYILDLGQGSGLGQLYAVSAGTFTPIGASFAIVVTSTDIWRIEAQGTTIRALKNGVSQASVTDATWGSGSAGLFCFSNSGNFVMDDWAGGDFSSGSADIPLVYMAPYATY